VLHLEMLNRKKLFLKQGRIFIFLFFIISSATLFAFPIAPMGEKLSEFLDSLKVSKRWLPNRYVEWTTGISLGKFRSGYGTNCSTFVAAAASRLGVYILSPPEQQGLLANAQYRWLESQGEKYGWTPIDNQMMAQKIANQGCLVVISYANPNRWRPGHIVIVRPSNKSKNEIKSRGPQIIQAGKKNYNSTTLSKAFKNPQTAFRHHRLVYYAHNTPFCRLLVKKEALGFFKTKRV